MNDLFPIHSSSVQVGDGCILFLGNSGAGKSTTATHFFRNNHKIVTDDLSLIDFDKNGHPFVYPSYPQLRLWEKSLDVFEIKKDDLIKINYQQSKFKKMLSLEDYASQPLPLKKMYFIALSSNDELNFTEIKGMEKVKVVSSQVFGDSIVKTFGKSVAYFTFCQQLTERIALCKIERPSNKMTIDEIYDYVLNDLKESKNII